MEKVREHAIGIAQNVFDELGPGLHECVYQKAMLIDLQLAGFVCQTEVVVPIFYKGFEVGTGRMDIVVHSSDLNESSVLVLELKAIRSAIGDTERTQLENYLKNLTPQAGSSQGLVINFPQTPGATEIQVIEITSF